MKCREDRPYFENSSYSWSRGRFCPQGTFGEIWKHFSLSQRMGKGVSVADIQWIKAGNAAKDTVVHYTPPIKELSGPK